MNLAKWYKRRLMPAVLGRIGVLGLIGSLGLLAGTVSAQSVYRCEGAHGPLFSDSPCEHGSVEINVHNPPPGGQLATPRPSSPQEANALTPQATATSPRKAASPCKTYTSTEARRLRIGEQVEAGMSREQVRESWGNPVDVYPPPEEMWTYDNRYHGHVVSVRRVYFKDGCVTGIEVTKP